MSLRACFELGSGEGGRCAAPPAVPALAEGEGKRRYRDALRSGRQGGGERDRRRRQIISRVGQFPADRAVGRRILRRALVAGLGNGAGLAGISRREPGSGMVVSRRNDALPGKGEQHREQDEPAAARFQAEEIGTSASVLSAGGRSLASGGGAASARHALHVDHGLPVTHLQQSDPSSRHRHGPGHSEIVTMHHYIDQPHYKPIISVFWTRV